MPIPMATNRNLQVAGLTNSIQMANKRRAARVQPNTAVSAAAVASSLDTDDATEWTWEREERVGPRWVSMSVRPSVLPSDRRAINDVFTATMNRQLRFRPQPSDHRSSGPYTCRGAG